MQICFNSFTATVTWTASADGKDQDQTAQVQSEPASMLFHTFY